MVEDALSTLRGSNVRLGLVLLRSLIDYLEATDDDCLRKVLISRGLLWLWLLKVFINMLPIRLSLRDRLHAIDFIHLLVAKVMKKLLILFLGDIISMGPRVGVLATELT